MIVFASGMGVPLAAVKPAHNSILYHAGDYSFPPRGKPHGRISSEAGYLLFVRGAADTRTPR